MSAIDAAVRVVMSDINNFSRRILRKPLRQYQADPLKAVLNSIFFNRGHEFLLIFPRQSGKNEAVAQLLTYLMALAQHAPGPTTIVYGASGDGVGRGVARLEEHLNIPLLPDGWEKATKPIRRIAGPATVAFLSTHPSAKVRGETAHLLLVIDELQDQLASHLEAVFTPMRAANNATALYLGTVKVTTDALWIKKQELERLQEKDGIQRVFMVTPEEVIAENRLYSMFLEGQVNKYGRNHPIVASEYFLEPIDGAGGLFPPRRQALMRGRHTRQLAHSQTGLFIAVVDFGGQDEASTDPIAQLDNPARDYTIAHVFEIILPTGPAPGPSFRALDVFVDHGSRHFQDVPGKPSLMLRLNAWLDAWGVVHTIADATGVGEGGTDWLIGVRGQTAVTGFKFGAKSKAELGSSFLSLVETGRFSYWSGDEDEVLSDGWWFWRQVEACRYELPPNGIFERDLRWSVPSSAKIDTPLGLLPIHDDRLVSAALVGHADELTRNGKIILGRAESTVIKPVDPLAGMSF